MLQSTIRRIRLASVVAVLIGSSVASSVASATAESPPADSLIVEPAPDERYVPTTTASVVESSSEPGPLEPVSDVPVPPDESTMIEPDGDGPSSDDPVVVEVPDDPVVVEVPDGPVPDDPVPDATSQEAGTQQSQPSDPDSDVPIPSGPEGAELGKAGDHTGEPGGGGDDHNESEEEGDHPGESAEDDDHQGCGGGGGDDQGEPGEDDDHQGCGGQGNPYRMTFAVGWYTSSGDQILQLTPEWRSWFKLEAAGQTGSGKATAATCTYPASSNDLTCQFQNTGHDAIVDGMVVPGKPTATYTVSVSGGPGNSNQWSISNANGGPYSARALCPRGGGGHDDGGHSADSLRGDEAWYCMHTIEMHQLITVPATIDPGGDSPSTVPPETEPPPPVPPAEIAPPAVDSPTTMAPVSTVSVTQNTLPATGNSTLTILLIGALMVAIGAMLVAQTRRGRNDSLSRPHDRLVP